MLDFRIFLALIGLLFMYIGARRGFSQEVVATAGIILSLFGLHQMDDLLRAQLLLNGPPWLKLMAQLLIFALVVYFAYHTRAIIGARALAVRVGATVSRRSHLQEGLLGGAIGALNGYLIGASIRYFADINGFPLRASGDAADTAGLLGSVGEPIFWLTGGPGGSGEPLSLAVFAIFLVLLILI